MTRLHNFVADFQHLPGGVPVALGEPPGSHTGTILVRAPRHDLTTVLRGRRFSPHAAAGVVYVARSGRRDRRVKALVTAGVLGDAVEVLFLAPRGGVGRWDGEEEQVEPLGRLAAHIRGFDFLHG